MNLFFRIFHAFDFKSVIYLGVCVVAMGTEKEDKFCLNKVVFSQF